MTACKARVRCMPQTGDSDYLKVHTLLMSKRRLENYQDALDNVTRKASDERAIIVKELRKSPISLPDDVEASVNGEPGPAGRPGGSREARADSADRPWTIR